MGVRHPLVVSIALLGACALPTVEEYASGSRSDGETLPDGGGAPLVEAGADASGPTEARDASATDALAPDDDAGVPLVNLVEKNQSDFEAGHCDDSGGYQALLQGSPMARSGQHACNVCRATPQAEIWSIDNAFAAEPAPGHEYRASAWVRRPSVAEDSFFMRIVLRTQAANYATVEAIESEDVALGADWQPITVTLTATKSAARADVYVYAQNRDGIAVPCFLVDDLAVWRTK